MQLAFSIGKLWKTKEPVFTGWYLVWSNAFPGPVGRLGFGFGSDMGGRNVVMSVATELVEIP
jgi:hypothetical protein